MSGNLFLQNPSGGIPTQIDQNFGLSDDNLLYLSTDKLSYFKYNSTTNKVEMWVNGNKTAEDG